MLIEATQASCMLPPAPHQSESGAIFAKKIHMAQTVAAKIQNIFGCFVDQTRL
jgi:hypothetical protein